MGIYGTSAERVCWWSKCRCKRLRGRRMKIRVLASATRKMGLSFTGMGEESSDNNTIQERMSSWMSDMGVSRWLCLSRVPPSGLGAGLLSLHILFLWPVFQSFNCLPWAADLETPRSLFSTMTMCQWKVYSLPCGENLKKASSETNWLQEMSRVLFQACCNRLRSLSKPNRRILSWEKHLWKRRKRKGKGGRRGYKGETRRSYKKEGKEEEE